MNREEFIQYFITEHYEPSKYKANTYCSKSWSSIYLTLNSCDYGFPKLLTQLNNEFQFNGVLSNIIQKYAPQSYALNDSLKGGHSITQEQLNIVANEAYIIYTAVQHWFNNLPDEHKNFIQIVERIRQKNNDINSNNKHQPYITDKSTVIDAIQEYIDTYHTKPPTITFNV